MNMFTCRLAAAALSRGVRGLLIAGVAGLAGVASAQDANTRPITILGNFDINGDLRADDSPDSDGDGLPDTWEIGGIDPQNTDVPFPAPTAIIPGIPPLPLFSRSPVRTFASARDSDGDGLSDFVEVFGLKFIDDDGDGILDDAAGGAAAGEWFDFNGDGLPSVGEFPAPNALRLTGGGTSDFDFDGFVFTDPSNPDTDADGILDGQDNDPLVNARAFGQTSTFVPTQRDPSVDLDLDDDGLGNGMDMGNDITRIVDNPAELRRVIELFRPDLLDNSPLRVSEGVIEDLLGADWNGDGLFRSVDVRNPHFGALSRPTLNVENINVFAPADDPTGAIGIATQAFPADFALTTYYVASLRGSGGVRAPLPFQEVLLPARRGESQFVPDPRIWTVVYAWRMPGFDIDGNGFIGIDSLTFSGVADINGAPQFLAAGSVPANAPASEFSIGSDVVVGDLDGVVEFSFGQCGAGACGPATFGPLAMTLAALMLMRSRRRYARPRT